MPIRLRPAVLILQDLGTFTVVKNLPGDALRNFLNYGSSKFSSRTRGTKYLCFPFFISKRSGKTHSTITETKKPTCTEKKMRIRLVEELKLRGTSLKTLRN